MDNIKDRKQKKKPTIILVFVKQSLQHRIASARHIFDLTYLMRAFPVAIWHLFPISSQPWPF